MESATQTRPPSQGKDYYTQAPNFVSAIQGDVDPRTGLFSASMQIANLIGNNNLGPTLSIALNYSPLSTSNDFSLGIGCSLGLSGYDFKAASLTLSTGEQYSVIDNSTELKVSQKKLDNFNFIKISDKEYRIIYKSGQIEVLKNQPGASSSTFVLTNIYTPAGHGLTLNWQTNFGFLQLQSVSDDSGNANPLCVFDYSNAAHLKVNIWPGTTEAYTIELNYINNRIATLVNTAQTPNLQWTFGYSNVNGQGVTYTLLTDVTAPTGYRQHVTYKGDAMPFPGGVGAPKPALPAVSSYRQTPGFGQPELLKNYSYTPKNYLGNDSGMSNWSASSDNLFSVMTNYEYGSTESNCDAETGNVLSTTKRTYNNYHLLTQELTRQGNCSRQTDMSYYAQIGWEFENQPSQYQQPYQQVVTYTDTSLPAGQQSRSEYTSTTFDNSGNALIQATSTFPILTLVQDSSNWTVTPNWIGTADGKVTTTTYYPAAGISNYCPPEPNGFVRFTQSQTVTPAPTTFSAPVSTVNYSYQNLSAPFRGNDNPIQSVVVAWQEQHLSDQTALSVKTTHYVDLPTSPEHGRVQHVESTIHGTDGVDYTDQIEFSFNVDGENLVQTATFTGWDNSKTLCTTTSMGKTQSRFSGRTQSVTDRYGNETDYHYDLFGRILSKTSGVGSDYESTTKTSYILSSDSQTGAVTKIATVNTDPNDNATITLYDGMGRPLAHYSNNTDLGELQSLALTQSQQYDNLGRAGQSSSYDWLRPKQPGGAEIKVTQTAMPYYDDWGQNHLTSYNDGHNLYAAYDPIQLQHVVQIQGQEKTNPTLLAKEVVQYDLKQWQAQATHYDGKGVAHGNTISRYDGLKRLREATDEMGNVTQYEYDTYGRVSNTTLPDGTVVQKRYAPFSSSALITNITVTDGVSGRVYDLGDQQFDSLHRLHQSSNGGRTYIYQYDGANAQPKTMTTPLGEVIDYAYIPQLGNALHQVTVGDLQQTLDYYMASEKSATGALKRATEAGGMVRSMTYTSTGKLDTESFQPVGSQIKSTQYAYSLLGNPQYYQDVAGAAQYYGYYANGSAKGIDDPAIQIALNYDTLGRLYSQTVTDTSTGKSLKTVLTLNDFNQEVQRDFYEDDAGKPSASITQHYWNNGQRKSRTTTQGGVTLRDESYVYDVRSRLKTYSCSGTALSVDPYGKAIQQQDFQYDGMSNITQCVTTFPGGSDTATFHYTNPDDPNQLMAVTHTHPDYPASITLQYDANGRMILDEAGRTLSYDALGRLQSVSGGGSPGGTYLYDALDTLVGQRVGADDMHELYYRSNILVNEFSTANQKNTRFVKVGNSCLGQSTESVNDAG